MADFATGWINFNSHAHVERDKAPLAICWAIRYFNSHAHVERDILLRGYLAPVSNFNSHAHVERDIGIYTAYRFMPNFNSHAHVERDAKTTTMTRTIFTSTHASRGRDHISPLWIAGPQISTHTLVSVTLASDADSPLYDHFNSPRSRGA